MCLPYRIGKIPNRASDAGPEEVEPSTWYDNLDFAEDCLRDAQRTYTDTLLDQRRKRLALIDQAAEYLARARAQIEAGV